MDLTLLISRFFVLATPSVLTEGSFALALAATLSRNPLSKDLGAEVVSAVQLVCMSEIARAVCMRRCVCGKV
jgi:hypothetical protein